MDGDVELYVLLFFEFMVKDNVEFILKFGIVWKDFNEMLEMCFDK